MLLRWFGQPGGTAGLEVTTDLLNWTRLATVVADANGLFQFTDTSAPLFGARFYCWRSP
jgi:hypothetical protein